VSSAVLIPRPETECLIDLAVAAITHSTVNPPLDQGHWVDLGTGSGAIAIGLADALHKATIHAVDYSPTALEIAQANAQNLGFAERIHFYQGSWWEPLASLKGHVSGMVSNPPYIPTETVATLEPEVMQHEPHLALDGGTDGLDEIRHLIAVSPSYLRPGGVWLIEMMAGQADTVRKLLQNQGSYCNIQIHSDLEGIERFALAYRSDK
jgi:release factor glutamine methyltransferase